MQQLPPPPDEGGEVDMDIEEGELMGQQQRQERQQQQQQMQGYPGYPAQGAGDYYQQQQEQPAGWQQQLYGQDAHGQVRLRLVTAVTAAALHHNQCSSLALTHLAVLAWHAAFERMQLLSALQPRHILLENAATFDGPACIVVVGRPLWHCVLSDRCLYVYNDIFQHSL